MERKRILVIEDDGAIRRGIVDALSFDGYGTAEAARAPEGLDKAVTGCYDLLLLDLVLPGGDGFDILKQVRSARPNMPVIILTARGDEGDRVNGLRLGADDYVVKPFSVKELLARVEAVLRRSPERARRLSEVRFAGGVADLARCEATLDDGRRVELSDLETKLLEYLASNAGRAIAREELLSRVWQMNPRGLETRAIDMHVARLREKLGDDSARPTIIVTVRGKGYMFGLAQKGGAT